MERKKSIFKALRLLLSARVFPVLHEFLCYFFRQPCALRFRDVLKMGAPPICVLPSLPINFHPLTLTFIEHNGPRTAKGRISYARPFSSYNVASCSLCLVLIAEKKNAAKLAASKKVHKDGLDRARNRRGRYLALSCAALRCILLLGTGLLTIFCCRDFHRTAPTSRLVPLPSRSLAPRYVSLHKSSSALRLSRVSRAFVPNTYCSASASLSSQASLVPSLTFPLNLVQQCMLPVSDYKNFKEHFDAKHPKDTIPTEESFAK